MTVDTQLVVPDDSLTAAEAESCKTASNQVKPAPRRIELGQLTQHNLKQLRLLNQSIFPITYTESFYTDLMKNPNLCRLAYFNDIVVGAVSYRIETVPSEPKPVKKCYIMTLGCLAPYRNLGVGTVMVNHVIGFCRNYAQQHKDLVAIYLHVHIGNTGAVDFYQRFGFSVTGQVENYYRRLEPQSAFLLEKRLDAAKSD